MLPLLAGWSLVLLAGCDYLRHWEIQREYERLQRAAPSQKNLKHLLDRPNFAVIGQTLDPADEFVGSGEEVFAVAAFSSEFRANELVDVMHDVGVNRHFGLDLPAGDYELLALQDRDGDGVYRRDEVVGLTSLALPEAAGQGRVASGVVIELRSTTSVDWSIGLPVERVVGAADSLFFPRGTIRALADPIFADEMVTLGLYDPAAFFERAPTLFYALEEDIVFKTPVIFVHGAGGSAREFEDMVAQLDRRRFKPWFFHYPSGADLEQLGELFHDIFLSGEAVAPNPFVPTVIIAHSMGGLVVREALRRLEDRESEPWRVEFISLATPFGGHPSADGVGDRGVLILPSWRGLDPAGDFLAELHREPLPASVRHHLFYAYDNDAMVKFGENSDGVVPLSSQLHPAAQRQAARQLGLASTHTGILRDRAALAAVQDMLAAVTTRIPAPHFAAFEAGGFEVAADDSAYSRKERFLLRHYGRFLEGLASGRLQPSVPAQRGLVRELRGDAAPASDPARAWRKFVVRRSR
ncbi:MAG: DUF413 domain-containing protein [bacterium]|nr:DUF413 domain-containing protein [bacterium]